MGLVETQRSQISNGLMSERHMPQVGTATPPWVLVEFPRTETLAERVVRAATPHEVREQEPAQMPRSGGASRCGIR